MCSVFISVQKCSSVSLFTVCYHMYLMDSSDHNYRCIVVHIKGQS